MQYKRTIQEPMCKPEANKDVQKLNTLKKSLKCHPRPHLHPHSQHEVFHYLPIFTSNASIRVSHQIPSTPKIFLAAGKPELPDDQETSNPLLLKAVNAS